MQFTMGSVSLNRPTEFGKSEFMGNATPSVCSTTTWVWGTNQVYSCPEIVTYTLLASKFVVFNDLPRLWDTNRGISLEDPNVASVIAQTMLKDQSPEKIAKFTSLYGIGDTYGTNFADFFTVMRAMTQQFLLGGAEFTLPVGHYIFGYNSKWVEHMYDERAFYDGKEVALDPFIN